MPAASPAARHTPGSEGNTNIQCPLQLTTDTVQTSAASRPTQVCMHNLTIGGCPYVQLLGIKRLLGTPIALASSAHPHSSHQRSLSCPCCGLQLPDQKDYMLLYFLEPVAATYPCTWCPTMLDSGSQHTPACLNLRYRSFLTKVRT